MKAYLKGLLALVGACGMVLSSWAATEVVATFKGFKDTLSAGGYTVTLGEGNTLNETTGAVTIDSLPIQLTGTAWPGTTGMTVLVKYSALAIGEANRALITTSLDETTANTDAAVGVYLNTSGASKGIANGSTWGNNDNGTSTTMVASGGTASGYLVLCFTDTIGTCVYDGTGATVYTAGGLKNSGRNVGRLLCVGGLPGGTKLPAMDMVVEGVAIYQGVPTEFTTEIPAMVSAYEAYTYAPYTATLTGAAANYRDVTWTVGAQATQGILTVDADAVLTLDAASESAPETAFEELYIKSSGSVTVKVPATTDAVALLPTVFVTDVTGTATLEIATSADAELPTIPTRAGFDVVKYMPPKASTEVDTTANCKTVLDATGVEEGVAGVTVDPQGGTVEVTGKYTGFVLNATNTQTTINLKDATIDCSENLNFGRSTVNISGETTINATRYITSQSGNGRTTTVNHSGGTITVSSTSTSANNQSAVLLAHYASNAKTFYTLNGGTISAPNGGLRLGHNSTATLTITDGGLLEVKNINGAQTGSALTLGANGTIKLGSLGFTNAEAFPFTIQDGGAFIGTDNLTVSRAVTLETAAKFAAVAEKTLTLSGAITATDAAITIGDAENTGTVVLSGLPEAYTGAITVAAGALDMGAFTGTDATVAFAEAVPAGTSMKVRTTVLGSNAIAIPENATLTLILTEDEAIDGYTLPEGTTKTGAVQYLLSSGTTPSGTVNATTGAYEPAVNKWQGATTGGDWSTDENWSEGIPTASMPVVFELSQSMTIALPADAAAKSLIVRVAETATASEEPITLTFTNATGENGALTVSTTSTLHANTDVSALTGTVNLGAVTAYTGVTLTVLLDTQYTSFVAESGATDVVVKILQPSGTIATAPGYKKMLDAPATGDGISGVTINPQGGDVEVSGKYASTFATTATGTETTFTFKDAEITTGDLNFGKGSIIFDNTNISASRLVMGDGGSNRPTTVTQTGGTITLSASGTGTTGNYHGSNPILLGHYSGSPTTYTLAGGELSAVNGSLMLGKEVYAIMNVSGGTLKVKRVTMHANGDNGAQLNLSAGVVELGADVNASTFAIPADTRLAITLSGGIFRSGDNNTIAHPLVLVTEPTLAAVAEKTMMVSGALSGSGTLTIGTETDTGIVKLFDFSGFTGSYLIATGATLQLAPTDTATLTNTFSGEGALEIASGTVNLVGATFVHAAVKSGATLIVKAGDEAKVTVEDGGTLQVVLSAYDLAYGYTPSTSVSLTYGTLVDGAFNEVTDAQGSVVDGAFVPPAGKPLVKVDFTDTTEDALYKNTGLLATGAATTSGAAFTRVTSVKDSHGRPQVAVQKASGNAQVTIPLTGAKLQNSTLSFWATKSSKVGSDGWDDSHRVTYTVNNTECYQYWEINSPGTAVSVYKSNMPGVEGIAIGDDDLHHWVIVTDETSQTFYVDGVAVSSATAVTNLNASSVYKNIILGWANSGHGAGACAFADIRVYNGAMTAEEVETLYWEGVTQFEADLTSDTTTLDGVIWKNGVTGTPSASSYVTLNVTGEVTLDLGETALTVANIKVLGTGALTLTGAGLNASTTTINADTDVSGVTTATLGTTTLAAETMLTMNVGTATLAGVGNATVVKTGAGQANVSLSTTSSPANYKVIAGTLKIANASYGSGGGGSFGAVPNFTVAKDAKLILDCHDMLGWTRNNDVTVAEVAGELQLVWVGQNETFSGRILLKDGGKLNNDKNNEKFMLHKSAVIAVEEGATATLQGNQVKVNNGTPAFEVGANATLNVTAPILRSAALKKTGAGAAVISAAVTGDSTFTIEEGVVRVADGGSVTGGAIAVNASAVLEFTNTTAKTFASAITGVGTIKLSGSAPVTFTGSLAGFTGTIEGGAIAIAQDSTLNLGRATLGTGVSFEWSTDATAGTLILAAGQETGVTLPEGVTLKLVLNETHLVDGYTPATNLPNVGYVTLDANGVPTDVTEADGTVNTTTGAFIPRHSVWTPVAETETASDWNTAANWNPEGVPTNKVVEFADLTGKTEETVTISADVTPKMILVNNATTKYTIGSTATTDGAIIGGIELVKRGSGEVVINGPSDGSTRIAEVVLEEGTVTVGSDYALHADKVYATGGVSSGANGSKLTIKGGTFDLNGKKAWDASVKWLTDYSITMGGSAVEAKLIDTLGTSGITLYKNTQLLTYIGTYEDDNGTVQYAPAATVEARLLGGYETAALTRIITVEQGAGSREGGIGYDLELKGALTNTPGRSDANVTLVKNGTGTLKISNANNFIGLTVEEGRVIVGDAEALAATTTIAAGATLDLNGRIEDGVSFAGNGTITSTTEVTLTIDHVRNFAGTITGNVKLAVELSHILEAGPLYDCTIDAANVTITGTLPSDVLEYNSTTGMVSEIVAPLDYQIRWMPMGDSITEGEVDMGKPEGTGTNANRGGYRYQLWKALEDGNQDVVTVGYRTGHKGTNEDPTTTDWAWHCGLYSGTIKPLNGVTHGAQYLNVESALENAGYPEIISLLLGINDVSKTSDISGLYEAWTDMVNKIAALRPQSKIVVSTLLPVYDSNTAAALDGTTEKRYNRFNKLVRDDAAGKKGAFENTNVIFIDVAKIALNDTFNAAYFMNATNVHPNETGSILVAKAFRLGFLEAIQAIRNDQLAIANVHNGEAGKVIVRLNKDPGTVTTATLTIGDVAIAAPGTLRPTDSRVLEFALATEVVPLQATTATLTLNGQTVTAMNVDGHPPVVEILGTYVASDEVNNASAVYTARQNVPEAYLEDFEPLKHYVLGETATAETLEDIETAMTAGQISRVGYYFELKRPNQPAQFVWVSMDASAFGDGVVNVGLPTAKLKAKVNHLQVYGNRGNFTNTSATDEDVEGIIEFSPYQWVATDDASYVNEGRSGSYGWNDDIAGGTETLKGCMQVARIRAGAAGNWQDPAAEMLFAYNNFACDVADDLGIGSFHVHLNNNGGGITSVFDWTNFASASGYTAYQANAYTSRVLEVWVKPMGTVVATVGGKEYDAVRAAVRAAGAGGTVTIVGEVSVDNLDLSNGAKLAFAEGASLTITGTLSLGDKRDLLVNAADISKFVVAAGATVELTEGTIEETPIPVRWTWTRDENGAILATVKIYTANYDSERPTETANEIITNAQPLEQGGLDVTTDTETGDTWIHFDTTLDGKGTWYEWTFASEATDWATKNAENMRSSGRIEGVDLRTNSGTTEETGPVYATVTINGESRQVVLLKPAYFWRGGYYNPSTTDAFLPFSTLTEFSAAFVARVPSEPGSVFITFGNVNDTTGGAISLVTGNGTDVVYLVYTPNSSDNSKNSIVLSKMMVPHAESNFHLYTFVRRPTQVEIYLDDTLVNIYKGEIKIADGGVQMGSPHGAFTYMGSRRDIDIGTGTPLQMINATDTTDDETPAAMDMLRLYDCQLTQNEVFRLEKEYPYESEWGEFERSVTGSVTWRDATNPWTKIGDTATYPEPTEGSNAILAATAATTVTVNPEVGTSATERMLETLTLNGSGTFAFESGTDTKPVVVSGVTRVNTNATVDFNALKLRGPVNIAKGVTLEIIVEATILETMALEVLRNGGTVEHNLTGLVSGEGTVKVVLPDNATMPTEWVLFADKDEATWCTVIRLSHNPWFIDVDGETIVWKSGKDEASAQPLMRANNIPADPKNLANAAVTISGQGAFKLPGGKTPLLTIKGVIDLSLTTETSQVPLMEGSSEMVDVPATTIAEITIAEGATLTNADGSLYAMPMTVNGTLAGGGTVSGTVTFAEGATLATTGLTVTDASNLVLPESGVLSVNGVATFDAPTTVLTVTEGTLTLANFMGPAGLKLGVDDATTPKSLTLSNPITVNKPGDAEKTDVYTAETHTAIAAAVANSTTASGVTTIDTVILVTKGTETEVAAEHMASANALAEVFTNVVTVEPNAEGSTTGTATITYDFGVERLTIAKNASGDKYVVLLASVKNAAENSTADFHANTRLQVTRKGVAVGLATDHGLTIGDVWTDTKYFDNSGNVLPGYALIAIPFGNFVATEGAASTTHELQIKAIK